MNRINAQGLNLIEYKKELNRNYSLLVKNALILALNKLVEEKKLDEETLQKIQDTAIDIQTFSRYLLSRKEYTKNTKELLAEFEKVRYEINAYLIKIGFVDNVSTESLIDKNIIAVLKTYNLPQDFILNYFGIKENQLEQLMKKKGFIEKFAVLRMTKVCKEICLEAPQDRYITQAQSLVYFNKETQSFSIDYRYNLNVDYIAQPHNAPVTLDKIKEIDETVEKLFLSKMGIDQYIIEPELKTSLQDEKQVLETNSYRKRKELTVRPEVETPANDSLETEIEETNIIETKSEPIQAEITIENEKPDDSLNIEHVNFENIEEEDDIDFEEENGVVEDYDLKEFLDVSDDVEILPDPNLNVDDSVFDNINPEEIIDISDDELNLQESKEEAPEEESPLEPKAKTPPKQKKQKNNSFLFNPKSDGWKISNLFINKFKMNIVYI